MGLAWRAPIVGLLRRQPRHLDGVHVAGTAVLGEYTRAYHLVFERLSNYLAEALTNVLFVAPQPAFQHDLARLRSAYFSVLSLGNLMLFRSAPASMVAAQDWSWWCSARSGTWRSGWFRGRSRGCLSCRLAADAAAAEAAAELNRRWSSRRPTSSHWRSCWSWRCRSGPGECGVRRRRSGPRSCSVTCATSPLPACTWECPWLGCGRRTFRRCSPALAWRRPSRAPGGRSPATFAFVHPGGRGRSRGAGAGAVHSGLPSAGCPLRAVDAPCRGRCARRGRRSSLAGGVALPRAAGPADSARGGIVTETLLLGLGLLVAAGLSVAALEVLLDRADVAAALVLGSVVVQAFVDRVPALVLPGGVQVYVTDEVIRWLSELRCCGSCGSGASIDISAGCCFSACCCSCRSSEAWRRSACSRASTTSATCCSSLGLPPLATFPPAVWLSDRIGRIWLAVSIPMMVLVSLRWLAVFAGIDLGVPAEKFGADAAIRVIDGPFTFFLACAFVLTIPAWLRGEQQRWVRRISVRCCCSCCCSTAGRSGWRSWSESLFSCCATGGSAAVRSYSSVLAP